MQALRVRARRADRAPGGAGPRRGTRRRLPLATRLRRAGPGYALIAPAVAATILFLFIPMFMSGYWSFTEFNGVLPPRWIGLQNYTSLIHDAHYQKAWLNTFIFVVFGMGVGPALGLMSALLLNQKIRFRALFRMIYFLPVMTSLVVVATIWKMLLNEQGIINSAFRLFGLPGHAWLSDTSTALPAVTVASIWQGFGFETVVFLAALQAIPRDLYDAAKVDGAGAFAQFRDVTLPALRPTILFVYVIGIIGSFQVFDQIFVMTQGGPIQSTRTVVFDLYDRFNSLQLGKASAVAYSLLVVLAILSFIQFRIFEGRE